MKRVKKGTVIFFSLLGFAAAILVVRCTPVKQYKVLSFFFDGVPNPNKAPDSQQLVKGDSNLIVSLYKPEFYFHKPYEEEKCKSCHAEGISNALLKPVPELCYTCHEDFNVKYTAVHGPVASGNCLMCHNQHMTKYEKLLIRPGQELCLYCHESKQVMANPLHKKIGTITCTECHNPHGGNNRGMLTGSSCYTCHTDFSSCYPVLHGPVASGNCTVCHDSHSSATPKHLVREGSQLCLFCHNSDQVYKSPAHAKVKNTSSCLECHNPHGGQDRFVLLNTIRSVRMPEPVYIAVITPDTVKKETVAKEAGLPAEAIAKTGGRQQAAAVDSDTAQKAVAVKEAIGGGRQQEAGIRSDTVKNSIVARETGLPTETAAKVGVRTDSIVKPRAAVKPAKPNPVVNSRNTVVVKRGNGSSAKGSDQVKVRLGIKNQTTAVARDIRKAKETPIPEKTVAGQKSGMSKQAALQKDQKASGEIHILPKTPKEIATARKKEQAQDMMEAAIRGGRGRLLVVPEVHPKYRKNPRMMKVVITEKSKPQPGDGIKKTPTRPVYKPIARTPVSRNPANTNRKKKAAVKAKPESHAIPVPESGTLQKQQEEVKPVTKDTTSVKPMHQSETKEAIIQEKQDQPERKARENEQQSGTHTSKQERKKGLRARIRSIFKAS
ncbi:MAG TPA: cytochrome c3 family protein [Bacteroidia bacterium]|jgi:predicted CXXCH cytochrome family protein|nr:cytochrome c3 family protein [Bacteroidia bacterium]